MQGLTWVCWWPPPCRWPQGCCTSPVRRSCRPSGHPPWCHVAVTLVTISSHRHLSLQVSRTNPCPQLRTLWATVSNGRLLTKLHLYFCFQCSFRYKWPGAGLGWAGLRGGNLCWLYWPLIVHNSIAAYHKHYYLDIYHFKILILIILIKTEASR